MTLLLEQAIEKLSHVPDDRQNTIASLILDMIADEERWELAFARSQDKLAKLAAKVRRDIIAGRIRKMGIDATHYRSSASARIC